MCDEVIKKAVQECVKMHESYLSEANKELDNKKRKIRSLEIELIKLKVKLSLQDYSMKSGEEKTETRYPDFDEYEDQIIGIMLRLPGLNIDEAYKIATFEKHERTGDVQLDKKEQIDGFVWGFVQGVADNKPEEKDLEKRARKILEMNPEKYKGFKGCIELMFILGIDTKKWE